MAAAGEAKRLGSLEVDNQLERRDLGGAPSYLASSRHPTLDSGLADNSRFTAPRSPRARPPRHLPAFRDLAEAIAPRHSTK
jgi:hypothetical protein